MLKDDLIRKLDEFIRKFYKNLLLKGLLYSVILLVVFYLLLSLLEYVGYNSTTVRTILFYLYLLFALIVVSLFVIRPAVKMFRIGKTLSYYDAAKIIGKHFPEVSDKLLNLLQLKDLSEKEDSDLLLASIEQKTRQLSPIPFHKAIDKSKLQRAGIIACCVAVVMLLTVLIFPSFLKDTTFRYVNHSTYFEKPAPFEFVLQNKSLTVLQQEDLKVSVKISGKALPEECNITVNGHTFRMRKESKTVFSYLIKQINSDTEFDFYAAGVESRPYMIKVKPKPVLVSIEADVIYPAYTGMKQETLSGINRISLPKGSQIVCKIQTRDTKHLFVNCNGKQTQLIPDKRGFAEYGLRAMSDMNVTMKTSNEYTDYSDSVTLQIITIEDMYPQIAVIEQKDSILPERILFRGQIKDDYGFDKLEFCVVKHSKGKDDVVYKQSLEVSKTENAQEFYHYYNIAQAGLANGESMEYYFQVWDNDAVNGSKSAKSRIFSLKLLSEEELEEKREQNSEDLKSETENILSSIKDLQKQIEEMNRKLIEKKELSWQDKKQLEELAKKQEELKDKIQEIKDKLRENNMLDEKLAKQQENDILEKQKELEALMDKVLNEDMKEMMEQIRKLANEQVDKQKLNEALNNIKQNNRDIEKQLDRNIEMYKHLEVEKKTDELIEKLKDLSEKQKELADKVKHESKENVSKQQNELQNEFEKQQEKLESIRQELRSMNEERNLKRNPERENTIKEQQQKAKENIDKGRKKAAEENMQQAAQKMQEMAEDLQQQKDENEEEQLAEDIEQVRAMLKNLVRLSMQEEELIAKTKMTKVSDAEYQKIIRKQYVIKEDMKMINDSLFAMSKRQPQVGNMINLELNKINSHLEKSIETMVRYNQAHYANYRNTSAASSQQYAMTSMNNLALMLSESIENMKQQQNQKNKAKGKPNKQCKNPSQSNKPSSKQSMKELQETLNKELERLQKELEKQKNNGKQKIGEGAKLNEELAKAAAQQEMIREMVKKAAEEAKRNGGKPDKKTEELQRQMEQTEKDIVNKTISRQTINRQAKILTRMLESEKAEKTKDRDFERKSETAKDMENEAADFPEFKKLKERESELFKQVPPIYSPFYKKKVNDYFYGNGGSNKQ